MIWRQSNLSLIKFLLLVLSVPGLAVAAVSSSSNYQIAADSISIGGGSSAGTSYSVDQTVGEVATGLSSSGSYVVNAGYQALLGGEIVVTSPGDVSLASSLAINEGGQVNATSSWVITSEGGGYQFSVRATTDPALKGSGARGTSISINDYAGAPDFDWLVGAGESGFGFSPEGVDLVATFKNNGLVCGAGTATTGHCWDGFATTATTVAQSIGAVTNRVLDLKLRAELGSSLNDAPTTVPLTINTSATLIVSISAS